MYQVKKASQRYRHSIVMSIHLLAVAGSNYAAFWLRFDGAIPPIELSLFRATLPLILVFRALWFIPFRMYQGLWRYTSIWDLRNLIAGVVSSAVALYALLFWVLGFTDYPRSIFIIDALLLMFLVGGMRMMRRAYKELTHVRPSTRVLIFGAGDAGEMIVRDMKRYDDYQPVGFIDDDGTKIGQRIHGVPVVGTRRDLPRVVAETNAHEVLVAIPRADPATIRGVVKALESCRLPIKTLPNLRDLLNGQVTLKQIRNLSIEDLLPRNPVGLNDDSIRQLIAGRRVVVTGAGGSIGSELCRQIAAYAPELLVLLERYENGLYAVENALRDSGASPFVRAIIGDVTDRRRVDAVFSETRPHLIFHAAAHKHVPLMQINPCEAVKNNVVGTRTVGEAAIQHHVERFVLISTDKAVNPSSVMGATKRVAELLIQELAHQSATRFVTVRFGNVLGSNGSVVPRFLSQIQAGGPVTVTHPEMRRYFMLIGEAVQLVLHAAGLGEGGMLYALDMGDQIKLVDLARNLIRLSGFVPDEEIPIRFIGSRPGEKLSEMLVGSDETVAPSPVEKILRVRLRAIETPLELLRDIQELEAMAAANDVAGVIMQLLKIVPTFNPDADAPIGELLPGSEEPVLAALATTPPSHQWSLGRA